MKDQSEIVMIKTPDEFSFKVNLAYLQRSPNECMYEVQDGKLTKAISILNEVFLIEVSENPEGNLALRFLGDNFLVSEEVRDEAVRYVREWFDLDNDLKPFYEVAKSDLLLQKVVDEFYGLRNVGIPDLFEALAWGIIGQQINLSFAATLKRRFVETFGRAFEWKGREYWLFPDPKDIAQLTIEDLIPLKISIRKCEYIIEVAKQMVVGNLSKSLLIETKDFKEAEKMLVSIRGIGPWTANYVLMRCLRFPNAFPVADVGLHNAIKHLTEAEVKPTKEEVLRMAVPWKGWESYATFYLWRFLY